MLYYRPTLSCREYNEWQLTSNAVVGMGVWNFYIWNIGYYILVFILMQWTCNISVKKLYFVFRTMTPHKLQILKLLCCRHGTLCSRLSTIVMLYIAKWKCMRTFMHDVTKIPSTVLMSCYLTGRTYVVLPRFVGRCGVVGSTLAFGSIGNGVLFTSNSRFLKVIYDYLRLFVSWKTDYSGLRL